MDTYIKTHNYIHQSQPPTIFASHFHSPHTSFPIIAVAIIGILATAFLLVTYYIFVIKCCLNWHRIDLLHRFSLSTNNPTHQEVLIAAYSPPAENRGVHQSVICSIPVLRFYKLNQQEFSECAVCLNEFHEQEKLRKIPDCGHVFHIDCIDVWLQSNSNCPLCRTTISIPIQVNPTVTSNDEDYVVIELDYDQNVDQSLNSNELLGNQLSIRSPSSRSLEQSIMKKKKKGYVSRGDECINIREKQNQFLVQPVRRSFSLDSADDRKLYLAVQEFIVEQSSHGSEI